MNDRTKRILARLRKRLSSGEKDSVFVPNDRRPSNPCQEHREEDANTSKSKTLTVEDTSRCNAEEAFSSPARVADFNSDDSVADRNYCPSPPSSDSDFEYENRDQVKRFLFKEDLITLHPETDRTLKELPIVSAGPLVLNTANSNHASDLNIDSEQTNQEQNEDLITLEDLLGVDRTLEEPIRPALNSARSEHDFDRIEIEQSPFTTTRPTADSSTKKGPKKRKRNTGKWKKNVAKKARLLGETYTSLKSKKEMKPKTLYPACKCRAKCYVKIKNEERQRIYDGFWSESISWEQRRQYVADRVTKTIKVRTRVGGSLETDTRKFNFNYSLQINDKVISVCKVMFLNTLSIGEKYLKTTMRKKDENGLTEADQRGKHVPSNKTSEAIVDSVKDHISSYPSYESHYTREQSKRRYLGPELCIATMYTQYKEKMEKEGKTKKQYAKEWLYREIFNTQFNLSFKLPGSDTCDDCDHYKMMISSEQDQEKKLEITKDKDEHLRQAQLRYNLKAEDKKKSYADKKHRVLFLDLQKCLPTPSLTNTQSFYLRKLWTLNLVIHDGTTKTTDNFVWPENIAGRGGNEIASCIWAWFKKHLDPTIEEVTIWTDNCAGQNRNTMVIACYLLALAQFPNIKRINHKFLLKGHTHMEVDHVHSMIERKKKHLSTMEILTPHDWAQFIRTCAGRNPFHVNEMTLNDFKDFTHLYKKSGAFIQRKKDVSGKDFKISSTVWWQLRRETPGILFFKTVFDEDDFQQVNMNRKVQRGNVADPQHLPNVRDTEKPISTAKYRDLQTLMTWVPSAFHDIYKNLPYQDEVPDAPELPSE